MFRTTRLQVRDPSTIFYKLQKYKIDYINTLKRHYRSKVDHEAWLVGYPYEEMIHPAQITQQQLQDFFDYIEKPYKNSFLTENWDQDLFAVFAGEKPLCLIDNDFLPVSGSDGKFDYEMRFAMQHAGLKKIVMDVKDDPTSLYYWPKHWKNACIMYMFHQVLLPAKVTGQIKSSCFHYFQGILLGYSKASIALYVRKPLLENKNMESYRSIYNDIDWTEVNSKYNMADEIIDQLKSSLTDTHRAMFSQEI